jgi:hypothetical protein
MGIIIHTSYPHPNFCPDFSFPQGQSFCPFQSSPSPHVGYAADLLLPFKVSAFATRLTLRILTAPRVLQVIDPALRWLNCCNTEVDYLLLA